VSKRALERARQDAGEQSTRVRSRLTSIPLPCVVVPKQSERSTETSEGRTQRWLITLSLTSTAGSQRGGLIGQAALSSDAAVSFISTNYIAIRLCWACARPSKVAASSTGMASTGLAAHRSFG
jgi:hypothetical protein